MQACLQYMASALRQDCDGQAAVGVFLFYSADHVFRFTCTHNARMTQGVAYVGLWREHHDELARFMAAVAPDGAAEAANLSGLTLLKEMQLAMQIGQLRCVALV